MKLIRDVNQTKLCISTQKIEKKNHTQTHTHVNSMHTNTQKKNTQLIGSGFALLRYTLV